MPVSEPEARWELVFCSDREGFRAGRSATGYTNSWELTSRWAVRLFRRYPDAYIWIKEPAPSTTCWMVQHPRVPGTVGPENQP